MAKINYVESYADLRFLYDKWALTFEGLDESQIDLVIDYIKENGGVEEDIEAYIIAGKTMNDLCQLTSTNAYPDDLNIISFLPYGRMIAISIGARWMTDIIDNNAVREDFHPFNRNHEEDEDLIDEIRDELEDDEAWGDNEWDEDDMYDDDDLWDEDHKQWDESYSKKIKESFRDNLLGKYGYIDLEVSITKDNLDSYINKIEKKYGLTVEKVTRHSYSGWPTLKIIGEVDVIKEYLWYDFFGNEGPIEYEYEDDFDDFVSDIRLIESTQVSNVSVGEIYDYLKTKTLVKDATLEDILKDKEATAWEYAFQKAKEKNNGYDEEEFLNVYHKALKTLKKESVLSSDEKKNEKLVKVFKQLQIILGEPIELLHAEWFPTTSDNLLSDEEICEGVMSKPSSPAITIILAFGFVIINHYSDLEKFGDFDPTTTVCFQISDFQLDYLFREFNKRGELK